MNLSNIFTQAHKLTKEILKSGDDYRTTFGECLKFLINKARTSIVDELAQMGLRVWEKYGKTRIYMSVAQFNEVTGANFTLSDRKNKIFYDFEANAILRSYNGNRPKVEIQY